MRVHAYTFQHFDNTINTCALLAVQKSTAPINVFHKQTAELLCVRASAFAGYVEVRASVCKQVSLSWLDWLNCAPLWGRQVAAAQE